jgi:hypothetical protein
MVNICDSLKLLSLCNPFKNTEIPYLLSAVSSKSMERPNHSKDCKWRPKLKVSSLIMNIIFLEVFPTVHSLKFVHEKAVTGLRHCSSTFHSYCQ